MWSRTRRRSGVLGVVLAGAMLVATAPVAPVAAEPSQGHAGSTLAGVVPLSGSAHEYGPWVGTVEVTASGDSLPTAGGIHASLDLHLVYTLDGTRTPDGVQNATVVGTWAFTYTDLAEIDIHGHKCVAPTHIYTATFNGDPTQLAHLHFNEFSAGGFGYVGADLPGSAPVTIKTSGEVRGPDGECQAAPDGETMKSNTLNCSGLPLLGDVTWDSLRTVLTMGPGFRVVSYNPYKESVSGGCSTVGVDPDTTKITLRVDYALHREAPLIAVSDEAWTHPGQQRTIDVLANDDTRNGGAVVVSTTDPANGSTTSNGATATYTPDPGFEGTDTFDYTVTDAIGKVDIAPVTVHVGNRPPVAAPDKVVVKTPAGASLNVIDNVTHDTDPDGDPIHVTAVTNGAYGTVTHTGDTVTYVPGPAAAAESGGRDTFTYTVSDPYGGTAIGTVTVVFETVAPPTVTWTWSMPPKLIDANDDGLLDYPKLTRADLGNSGTIRLDGCLSSAAPGDAIPRTSYRWTVNGSIVPSPFCTATVDLPSLSPAPQVRLDVTTVAGQSGSLTKTIHPRNLLIVSLGDSFASGEGAPDIARTSTTPLSCPLSRRDCSRGTWENTPCHRSANAGTAVAAKKLEDASDQSIVTFVHLACSGATIPDGFFKGKGSADGIDLRRTPSQYSQLRTVTGIRTPDAVTLSFGGNDIGFSAIITACMDPRTSCATRAQTTAFNTKLADLRFRRIPQLAACLTFPSRVRGIPVRCTWGKTSVGPALGIPKSRILYTPYPDFTRAVPPRTRTAPYCSYLTIDPAEFRWAQRSILGPLNAGSGTAWGTFGVRAGLSADWTAHGICASPRNRWVNRLDDAMRTQGGDQKSNLISAGAFHPNRAGYLNNYAPMAQRFFTTLGLNRITPDTP